MPRGDKTKEPAFRMWLQGKPLKEIQREMQKKGTLPSSVAGWILDWERGKQRDWTPKSTESKSN